MRKKLLLVAVMLTALWGKSFACGWDDWDWYYYNLFSQEIMNDPIYRPFLLTYEAKYYSNDTLRNGNKTGKGQFSFQSQRKAMQNTAQTTTQLHSSHMLVT